MSTLTVSDDVDVTVEEHGDLSVTGLYIERSYVDIAGTVDITGLDMDLPSDPSINDRYGIQGIYIESDSNVAIHDAITMEQVHIGFAVKPNSTVLVVGDLSIDLAFIYGHQVIGIFLTCLDTTDFQAREVCPGDGLGSVQFIGEVSITFEESDDSGILFNVGIGIDTYDEVKFHLATTVVHTTGGNSELHYGIVVFNNELVEFEGDVFLSSVSSEDALFANEGVLILDTAEEGVGSFADVAVSGFHIGFEVYPYYSDVSAGDVKIDGDLYVDDYYDRRSEE